MAELFGDPHGTTGGSPETAAPRAARGGRRRLKRFLARFVIPGTAVVALFVAIAAWAFFTSNGTGTGTATVGTLTAPQVTPAGSPAFDLANMVPGDSVPQTITVTAPGGAPSQLSIYEPAVSGTLLPELDLKVTEDGSTVVYDGPLASGWTAAAPLALPGTGTGGMWAPDESHTFVFTVSFPSSAGNSFQHTNATASFVWTRRVG